MPRKNRQFGTQERYSGPRSQATGGSALPGSPENRYHSLEVQGSSEESLIK